MTDIKVAKPGDELRLPPFRVDRQFGSQRILDDTGLEWPVTDFNVPAHWTALQALPSGTEKCRVAVLDTGIDALHRAAGGELYNSVKNTKAFAGSSINDLNGHGTHCAGIVAAENTFGRMSGVSLPQFTELYIGKVLSDAGSGTEAQIAAGIRWAIDQKVDVISMSFGSTATFPAIERAIREASAAGILLVAAAGNDGTENLNWPAQMPEVIAVGAVNRDWSLAYFSTHGDDMDTVAPGVNILSCWRGGSYAQLSGTSMATPWVAGALALRVYMEKALGGRKTKTPADWGRLIASCCDDLGETGKDKWYGLGIFNFAKLLDPLAPNPPPPPGPVPLPEKFRITGTDIVIASKWLEAA